MLIKTEVRFKGELPIRLPVPDGVAFASKIDDAQVAKLVFREIAVERPSDQGSAVNIDDGMGNYLRTQTIINFTYLVDYDPTSGVANPTKLRKKILSIVNAFIDVCRYVTRDPKLVTIRGFPGQSHYEIYRIDGNVIGELLEMYYEINTTPLASPFSIGLPYTLDSSGVYTCNELLKDKKKVNPSWLLWVTAKRNAYFADIKQCILNLAISLEVHIPNVIKEYKERLPADIDLEKIKNKRLYSLYDSGLKKLGGESLHTQPELFQALEYIRVLRNSIVHDWSAKFSVKSLDSKNYESQYLKSHQFKDNHQVTTENELHQLVDQTEAILDFVDLLFATRYPPSLNNNT